MLFSALKQGMMIEISGGYGIVIAWFEEKKAA
jgi:hypothetical protein